LLPQSARCGLERRMRHREIGKAARDLHDVAVAVGHVARLGQERDRAGALERHHPAASFFQLSRSDMSKSDVSKSDTFDPADQECKAARTLATGGQRAGGLGSGGNIQLGRWRGEPIRQVKV